MNPIQPTTSTTPTTTNNTTGTISGNVTASNTISSSIRLGNGINPAVKIDNAEVWLEDLVSNKTRTDRNGSFTLTQVPFGTHRIVAKYMTSQGTFKVRSDQISVSFAAPQKQSNDLDLIPADKVVRGVLNDKDGTPISYATLSLWGETFTTDANGVFVSPPLPENETTGLIKVVQATNFQTTNIEAPLSSGKTTTAIEISLPKIEETNRPPLVVLTASSLNPSANQTVTLVASATDPDTSDPQQLTVTWEKTDGSLATSANKFQAAWTAPSQAGIATVSVRVTDSQGAFGYGKIAFSVGGGTQPTNNPPTGSIIGTSSLHIGNAAWFGVSASDSDGDYPLTFLWSSTTGTFSAPTSAETQWIAPNATGTFSIQCAISDSKGATIHKFHQVVVYQNSVTNLPPTGYILATNTVLINSATVVSAIASDPENGILTYQWNSNAGRFSSPTDATTTWTAPSIASPVRLICLISDDKGGQVFAFKTVFVTTSLTNAIPVVSISGTSTVGLGETTVFTAVATDTDGDTLSFSWSSSGGGSFSSPTGSSTNWTAPNSSGTLYITCHASDGNGGVGSASVQVGVYPVGSNSPPVALIIATSSIPVSSSTVLVASATDPNGDTLTYSWTASLGTLSGTTTPSTTWTAPSTPGTATFYCTVSDGKGGNVVASHSISVFGANQAPTVLISISSATVPIAGSVQVVASATDLDGDPLTYSWTGTGGTYGSTTNLSTTWTAPGSPGTFTLFCTVSDGRGGIASATQNITVTTAPNQAPTVLINIDATTVPIASSVQALASATDLDGDPLTYTWTKTGGTLSSTNTASTTWTAPSSGVGSFSLLCTVSDGKGGTASAAVALSVPAITLFSSGFPHNADLASYTAYLGTGAGGANTSPPFSWSNVPANTQSLAFTCYDVTASFSHWVMYNIPATYTSLPAGLAKTPTLTDGILQGINDFPGIGYDGPEPPAPDPYHYYYFTVFALDNASYTASGATFITLVTAMNTHIISQTSYIGKYDRP